MPEDGYSIPTTLCAAIGWELVVSLAPGSSAPAAVSARFGTGGSAVVLLQFMLHGAAGKPSEMAEMLVIMSQRLQHENGRF
jgi:hypothetical protein